MYTCVCTYTSTALSCSFLVKNSTLKSPNPVLSKDCIRAAFYIAVHLFNTLDLNPSPSDSPLLAKQLKDYLNEPPRHEKSIFSAISS